MSANHDATAAERIVNRKDGLVWNRLHAEREEIREVLLKDFQPETAGLPAPSRADVARATYWHRELLQARLRKIDDALDRLMSGAYGNCSQCGRWIEDTKLDFDPALTYCIECWQRMQTFH